MTVSTLSPYWQPELETIGRRELERLQAERLATQIQRAAVSPFYQRLWNHKGPTPAQIRTVRDVIRLPFLHKPDLLDAQFWDPPFGDLPMPERDQWREVYPVNVPGGSAFTVYCDDDLARTAEIGARILWAIGLRPGQFVHNAFAYGLFAGGIFIHRAIRAMGAGLIPIGTDSVKRQVEALFAFKPAMLTGAPSQAIYLAERVRERGLSPRDIGIAAGLFGAEPGASVSTSRSRLEQLFGCRAYDLYGITEVATLLAAECPLQQGLHWAEDHVLVEVVDPDTQRPSRPGEQGVLVLTDLTRKAMPLLRYWTGDMTTLAYEPCACGRTHARSVGGITGRTDEMIMYRGAKFYPSQVERILASYGNLGEEFKILLERDVGAWADKCQVIVEAAPGGAYVSRDLEERVQRHLQDELGAEITVQVVRFGGLGRSPSKSRRVDDRR